MVLEIGPTETNFQPFTLIHIQPTAYIILILTEGFLFYTM